MWSAQIVCSAPPSLSRPWTVITLEPMPSISRAHLDQQPGEVLDVRLAGGVGDRRRARGQRRRHQRVLGPHHRRLVHEDRARLAARRSAPQSSIQRSPSTCAPRSREGVEVRVEAAAADEVAAGRRHRASPKRASSGPASRNEARIRAARLLVDARCRRPRRPAGEARSRRSSSTFDAEAARAARPGLGVADPRHVGEHHLLLGEQAGGEDRQRRVLVAGGGDLARERGAALDDELLHRSGG